MVRAKKEKGKRPQEYIPISYKGQRYEGFGAVITKHWLHSYRQFVSVTEEPCVSLKAHKLDSAPPVLSEEMGNNSKIVWEACVELPKTY